MSTRYVWSQYNSVPVKIEDTEVYSIFFFFYYTDIYVSYPSPDASKVTVSGGSLAFVGAAYQEHWRDINKTKTRPAGTYFMINGRGAADPPYSSGNLFYAASKVTLSIRNGAGGVTVVESSGSVQLRGPGKGTELLATMTNSASGAYPARITSGMHRSGGTERARLIRPQYPQKYPFYAE